MAQIYGELIRAQLQSATNLTIGADAAGLIYLHTGDKKLTVHDGSVWQKLVTETALNSSLSGKVDANAAITGATKTKITFDSKGLVTSGADLEISDIPTITAEKGGLGTDASTFTGVVKASSGTFSAAELVDADISATAAIAQSKIENLTTDLGSKVDANTAITGDTKTKITYDSKGLVTAGADLESADLPSELLNKLISSTDSMTGALTLPAGTTLEQPLPAAQGMIRYNTTDATFEGYDGAAWGAIGGGGGGTTDRFVQASPALAVGDAVYLNGSVYTKAIATAANTAEVVGVISKDPSTLGANNYEITLSGEVTGLTGLTVGEVYFLSPTTAGLLTTTEPSTIGQVSVPVGVASSATSMYVAPKRGVVVGGVNARTEVALTSGATTNVQSVAGMTAGDLSGWVFISSASPVRFYVSAKFALSGAGGDYNLNYQTTGDAPPAGFLIDITTSGMIRVTLPASSGSTSVINYALNAPAIGASLPLTVSSRRILGDTSGTSAGSGIVGEIKSVSGGTGTFANGANITSTVTSLSLTAGTWMVTAGVQASGTTMNYWRISLSSSASFNMSNAVQPQAPATGGYTSVGMVSAIFTFSTTTAVNLIENHWIVSGTNTWTDANIVAIRIA